MNTSIINNYSRLKLFLFFPALFFLIAIALFLYSQDALCTVRYIQIQKDTFFFINHNLGQYPNFEYNLTQLGDALVFLPFLSIFILYAPKIWEAILSALLVSILFSCLLKKIFAVPRPAAIFNNNTFIIVGKTLCGHNSLPSGHSVIVFIILTVLLFAFMPKEFKFKILWIFLIITIGLILVSSRIGVGAHYPLDVIVGSIFGYISGLTGIFISQKYKIWTWIGNKKCYPIFILLFLICCISLINRIINENLIIFYFAFISLAVSLYKITTVYVQK
ncbi:phosphatase PAP2 family protein [Flavobacterium sp. ANB]|uniref:phosphatase PAP2 family protein n=1 Tax=unclassified Flavobacterium TaxID=196869 RepID=UPI0012B8C830|nr:MULTISPECIES: phosphatase PAP2 family protein [unclassified Flavobacterium]MBF4516122.1 phosphatase PAP2 family protein [Flavobacterium sp. ANB]MTD72219.1 phosphatase PAP2 family protein [Flavobacterium sp. LC2016-13]